MPKRSHSDGEDDKKDVQVDTKEVKKQKKPRTASTAERTGAWSEAETHDLLIFVLAHATSLPTGQAMYDQIGARLGRSPKSVKNMWLMRLKKEVEDAKASLG